MSDLTVTATISNDISYTIVKLGSNTQSESASLAYSQALTSPTGTYSASALQINYGVLQSGSVPASGKVSFDLKAFEKESFGASANISFTKIKSILVENRNTSYGEDLIIGATGTKAFTEPWNNSGGGSIKPYAVWSYSDPISGAVVDATNKEFVIQNNNTGTPILYTTIAVGVTG